MQFEVLKAWQKARELTNGIYQICKTAPLQNDFGLRDQLQRAEVSAMTNLAEGFDRAGEVKSLLYVSQDNHLADKTSLQKLNALAIEVSALSQGLINSFNRRRME